MHRHLRSTGLSELASDTLSETLPNIELAVSNADEEKIETIERGNITAMTIYNTHFLILDHPLSSESTHQSEIPPMLIRKIKDSLPKVDYLVVSSKYKESIEKLYREISPDVIVLHPSISKNREKELLAEADSLQIKVHSLRIHDALQIPVR